MIFFCGESIECFPGVASRFVLKIVVIILIALFVVSTTIHFVFHFPVFSLRKNLVSILKATYMLQPTTTSFVSLVNTCYMFRSY